MGKVAGNGDKIYIALSSWSDGYLLIKKETVALKIDGPSEGGGKKLLYPLASLPEL